MWWTSTCWLQFLFMDFNTPIKKLSLTRDRWTFASSAGSCSRPDTALDSEIHWVGCRMSNSNKYNPVIKCFIRAWSECTIKVWIFRWRHSESAGSISSELGCFVFKRLCRLQSFAKEVQSLQGKHIGFPSAVSPKDEMFSKSKWDVLKVWHHGPPYGTSKKSTTWALFLIFFYNFGHHKNANLAIGRFHLQCHHGCTGNIFSMTLNDVSNTNFEGVSLFLWFQVYDCLFSIRHDNILVK